MSALEETKSEIGVNTVVPATQAVPSVSVITRVLNLLSSVRFGIVLLMLLVAFSMAGMLIMQKNVEGFERYFDELTPATRMLFGGLGLFDVYHAWYFNLLLLVLSLNIVLASIDRFPKAWTFISRPKLDAGATWLKGQPVSTTARLEGDSRAAIAERLAAACRAVGLRPRVTEKGGKTFVFAERGAWNRLGAYAVHVALLTIFLGGFMTNLFQQNGQMPLRPGASSNEMTETVFNLGDGGLQMSKATMTLPFEVTCEDIQQKLIRQDGPITADNTIDWLTKVRIKDERGEHEALVHMNNPHDYRGYRFFQASFISVGRARQVTLRLTREADGYQTDVTLPRAGSVNLSDGTHIEFVSFQPDFTLAGGQATTASGEYNNPAAILSVTGPDGKQDRAYAFAGEAMARAPMLNKFVGGYKFKLVSFEKVPDAHVLAIQKDPGATVFYVGSAMLFVTLAAVFFFSHQRVWALIEERAAGRFEIMMGGNSNRNAVAFEDRFKRLVALITGRPQEVQAEEQS